MPQAALKKATSQTITYFFEASTEKLSVSWFDTKGKPNVFIIGGWSCGLDWQLLYGKELQPVLGSNLLARGIEQYLNHDTPETMAWWATFPQDIAERLRVFKDKRFELARICQRLPAAVDLLKANPLLLYLLVLHINESELDYMLCLKQIVILQELGFHKSKPAIKFLKKINLSQGISKKELSDVIKVLKDERKFTLFSHCKKVNFWTLEILLKNTWLMDGKLIFALNKLENDRERNDVCQLIIDSLRMGFYHGIEVRAPLNQCKHVNAVRRIHDYLAEQDRELRGIEVARQEEENKRRRKLHSKSKSELQALKKNYLENPPHPGTLLITPLSSRLAILEEGREMKHCITSYINRVERGSYYVYRMEKPERLTIGVSCSKGKFKRVAQVKGKHNREASFESMKIINVWEAGIKMQNELEKMNSEKNWQQ